MKDFSYAPAPPPLLLKKPPTYCMNVVVIQDDTQEKREKFVQLLQPVKKHLYNFINKSLNFADETDDIFQDTVMKGFRYFYSYDPGKPFKTWIFTVAHNRIKDFYRKNRTTQALDDRISADLESVDIQARVIEIYEAVKKLKPHHREIFYLYYYNEFKIAEIAKVTGKSQANVKFILNQSRKKIRGILEVHP